MFAYHYLPLPLPLLMGIPPYLLTITYHYHHLLMGVQPYFQISKYPNIYKPPYPLFLSMGRGQCSAHQILKEYSAKLRSAPSTNHRLFDRWVVHFSRFFRTPFWRAVLKAERADLISKVRFWTIAKGSQKRPLGRHFRFRK